MKLDENQTARVREWIHQGLKVAEIQTRLADELGVKLTYMEARFLLDDLRLQPKDPPPPPKPAGGVLAPGSAGPGPGSGPGPGPGSGMPPGGPRPGPGASAGPSGPGGPGGPGGAGPSPFKTVPHGGEAAGGGRVVVSVDEIARPSMLVSGKVTFSDGQQAEWGIDQMGRPMLMPKQQGYRPSQADIVDFQTELEQVLSRFGY